MSYLPCHYRYISFILLHYHKCTQPCYFSFLLKPAAQKEKMDWNSSTWSSRLRVALVAIPVVSWNLLLSCFIESRLSLLRHYLCNNYTLFVAFGYLWTLLAVCVEQLILGHAYDEYSVLAKKKLGMTNGHSSNWQRCDFTQDHCY
jgi:hypothetical protein